MIKDPCEKCAEAYGHNGACPTIIKNEDEQLSANAEWTRGYNAAAASVDASAEDKRSEHYMLGRKVYELEVSGRMPKRRKRVIRVPAKSEPRMTAISSIRADT
jgi:hypothetical protein